MLPLVFSDNMKNSDRLLTEWAIVEYWLTENTFLGFFPHKNFSYLNDLHLEVPATCKGSSIYHRIQEYGQKELYFIVIVFERHSLLSKFQPENQWGANQDQF